MGKPSFIKRWKTVFSPKVHPVTVCSRTVSLPTMTSNTFPRPSHETVGDTMSSGSDSSARSSGSSGNGGISRRKIVTQNQMTLHSIADDDDGDVWTDPEVLFSHHLKEVLDKWSDIDDEIWGKLIYMEKGRRVAKAYCRVPMLTIDGSDTGFDGRHIGLDGFDNPKRDSETTKIKQGIEKGFRIKMDDDGNIFVKKTTAAPMCIKTTNSALSRDSCLSAELLEQQGQLGNQVTKIFDMKRFTQNIATEMKSAHIDRHKLQLQCIVNISFGSPKQEHLESPCWLMLLNIVAMDMLRNQLPEELYIPARPLTQVRFRAPKPVENVSATRYLSTPRDEHYPKLLRSQQEQLKSSADVNMAPVVDYGNVGLGRNRQSLGGIMPMHSAADLTALHNFYTSQLQLNQIPMDYTAQFRQPLQSYQGLQPRSQKQLLQDANMKRYSSFGNLQSMAGFVPQPITDWE